MSTHDEVLHQLLTLEDQRQTNDLLLSLYLPIGATLPHDLQIELHALLIANLRSYEQSQAYPQAHHRIADYLTSKVMQLNPLPKGIGIFASLAVLPLNQVEERKIAEHITDIMVPFQAEVTPMVFIGQVFDLRPLFQLDRKSIQALVVSVDDQQAILYELVDTQLTKIKTIKNIWSDLGEDEAHSVKSLGTAGTISHGTGYDSVKRRQQAGNNMVLHKVAEALKTHIQTSHTDWKQLVMFLTNNVHEVIATNAEEIQRITGFTPLVSRTIPGTEQEVIQMSLKLIHQQQLAELHQLYDQYEQEYHQWAKGWQAVTDAVRRRQVDTLLITPRAEHDGYVQYNELPYTQPTTDSQHVHNLAPWLTKIVYQCNGEVIASNQLPKLYHEPVVARLRYVPK